MFDFILVLYFNSRIRQFTDRMRHHIASHKFGSLDYRRLCNNALKTLSALFLLNLKCPTDEAKWFAPCLLLTNLEYLYLAFCLELSLYCVMCTSLRLLLSSLNLIPTKHVDSAILAIILIVILNWLLFSLMLDNKCFAVSCFSGCWKSSYIVPIKNSSEASDPTNF